MSAPYLPAPVYTHKDPNGWDHLSITLPYKTMPSQSQALLSDLVGDIQQLMKVHAQRNGWTHYVRDHGGV